MGVFENAFGGIGGFANEPILSVKTIYRERKHILLPCIVEKNAEKSSFLIEKFAQFKILE